jgi:hypothetical protein
MPNLPEIRMRYGWLLANNASVPMNKLWGKGEPLESAEYYNAIVDKYWAAWEPYQNRILRGMQELLGIEFRQDIIDVYIAPWFHAFSDPMVFGIKYEPDRFVDVFTHELLHRLMTDAKQLPFDHNLLADWTNLFGEQNTVTLVHIPVHAVHKAVLLDVLNEPQRLERELEITSEWPDYKKAWDYIQAHDYRQIINDLKKIYH